MAQPSVACFFNTRKRSAVEDTKINRVKKVLVLDSSDLSGTVADHGLESVKRVIFSQSNISQDVSVYNEKPKLQNKDENFVGNKILINPNVTTKSAKKTTRGTRLKKTKEGSKNKDIQLMLSNMITKELIPPLPAQETVIEPLHELSEKKHVTPPNSPRTPVNAMDKLKEKSDGPSIKELRKKMSRSSRLAELKASVSRFNEKDAKLKEIEKKTSQIPESPRLKNFKTLELEVCTSPLKVFSPEKAYLSPKKDSSARRNLFQLSSPTKNAVAALPASPSKTILEETSKPALTLPYKYRYLAEIFRCIDTVSQILFNRKETITFRKLKPAVEQMLKRNLMEKHLAQIRSVYPGAFVFTQEKLRVFGAGQKKEQWELVLTPNVGNVDHMNSEILLHRRRKLFGVLLNLVKNYHAEFLMSLDPPMHIDKDKITRWHPEFDIEKVPDIELAELPAPPAVETLTTGKDVLAKAKEMFNCNTRMELALQRLKEARANTPPATEEKPKEMPTSLLKGIPKSLLEKVRQKQAAKALVSMTRSADKEKEVLVYSRLPEIARLTRNVFVSEKKGVLPLQVVIEKLGNCYRTHLTKTEMEEHLKTIAKELPSWLVFHNIRNCEYLKLAKSDDLSVIVNKLENLAKEKSES